ncbi:hypothetical protein [Novosphingobium panipatense]|uniref:Uncharacterized protein n=1 Tax=Novosphingobium panipatense TaxID=428991 RepID=A0ABY1Q7S5_9SPHN|nr:hypothetical protein [Novosphingobium panipatense]SMP58349.1 hypothetical protein SAMN06296065_102455 [Novosphingobium panipatense]
MNTQSTLHTIVDSTDRLHLEVDRNLKITSGAIEASQEVPDEVLRRIRDTRDYQDAKFAPDDVKIAELPGALVDHWYRQGFSIWDPNITAQDILNRLQREDLSAFICTSKTFR